MRCRWPCRGRLWQRSSNYPTIAESCIPRIPESYPQRTLRAPELNNFPKSRDLGDSGQNLAKFGQSWPQIGQRLEQFGQTRPELAQIGQNWPKLTNLGQSPPKCSTFWANFGRFSPKSANFRPSLGQLWRKLAKCWPNSPRARQVFDNCCACFGQLRLQSFPISAEFGQACPKTGQTR